MTRVETLSGIVRLAATGPWDGFEAKRVLMDLYAARAALAQTRAALEATSEHESMKGAADHEKALFNRFGKSLPKALRAQEEAIQKFEEIALGYTKAAIHHSETLNDPDLTETIEAHLNRRAELFGDVAEAAMRDILSSVSKETMMVQRALPKILDAIKASEESQILPDFSGHAPHSTLIPAPPVPQQPGPIEWEISEEDVEEAPEEVSQWEPEEDEEEIVEWEPEETVEWEPEDREEEIQEDAMEVMASHEPGHEDPQPTSDFVKFLEQIAKPLEEFFKKNTLRINDALKASNEALEDYQSAVKAAANGRVASEKPNHGFRLNA